MTLAIDLSQVTKEYPGILALDKVDLKVKKGSIHGFIGPNGAGKSTTMNIISGLIPPTSGEVKVQGLDCLKDYQKVRGLIGLLPEHPPLYQNMQVEEYLTFCQKINMPYESTKAERDSLRQEIIERCGLNEVTKRLIGNLSKGFRQRVAMAQALCSNPEIVILDEPTVGLDPNAIHDVRELILELKEKYTILLSTHQLHEVGRICDEVTIINNGKILRSGTIQEVQSEFSAYQTYEALVASVSDGLRKELLSKSFIEGMDVLHENEGELLRIRVSSGGEDHRPELTKLISHQAELLEFKSKKMELEDIFREVVK